ncbi:DUF1972 domain-containing protein [Psychrosphaera aestuarii]|uniref:DUF1972 domain-containing protein n=1 Tax=Psychrosphaera aestuarii TaxID=1266052 RepID=UPI001B3322B6|nr:DUF1972 domain-containing protein [Psychrosphaera aestuarii]
MNISIIGTVGVPACYGGFETLVENLLDDNSKSNEFTIYCSAKSYDEKIKNYKNAELVYLPLKANGIQSVPYDIWSILHSVFIRKSKKILILGVSGAICLPFVRLFSKAKIVTNIDGLEWKRDKWGAWAKRFLKFSENLAVKHSDIIVADNRGIADYVTSEYEIKSEVIAYGGDHAIVQELNDCDEDYALALCRIEPENNVELILESFSRTSRNLKFIGNWDNSEYGKSLKSYYSQFSNIEIIDPIYDVHKLFLIREACKFYVHGHSAGGTNPSLVEMMHFKKPILAFDCNYNRASTEEKAYYFSDCNDLIKLIKSPEKASNGKDMKEIAQRKYTWDIVKQQYLDLFDE